MSKIRPVVLLILMFLICEAIAVSFLIKRGWFGSGERFQLATLIVLIAIPLAILAGCISRGTTRFSLWQMLIGFALLSTLFASVTKPIVEFRFARMGSIQLTRAGCSLTASAADMRSNSKPLSSWMNLFVDDCSRLPSDDRVTCIVVHDDQQLQLLIENAKSFPLLKSITLYRISTESMEQLMEVLPEFEQLIDVWSHNVVFPVGWFQKLPHLQSIGVSWQPPSNQSPIHISDLAEIALMSGLVRFSASGIRFDDEHAAALGSSRFVKEILLRRTQISPIGEQLLKKGLVSRQVILTESAIEDGE